MAQHVIVTEYNPLWPQLYRQEAEQIRAILRDNCVAIHHIGSTAVVGLCAKPVMDIMPVVVSLARVDAQKKAFEAIGYEVLGEFGIAGRRYLRKGGDERTHQLHIFEQGADEQIERHLALRDYLRAHPQDAAVYGRLKRQLAQQFPWDIESYCDGKDDLVRKLEQAALQWRRNKEQSAL